MDNIQYQILEEKILESIRDIKLQTPSKTNPWYKKLISYLKKKKHNKQLREYKQSTKQKQPLVSLIITTFNSHRFLDSLIKNLQSLEYTNIELIIIDDNSTDNTISYLSELINTHLKTKFTNIKFFESSINRGPYWCKNYALTIATGDYVAFQDSDDISLSNRLNIQIQYLEDNLQTVACLCHYERVDSQNNKITLNNQPKRIAYISLVFDRELILNKLGFFDCVKYGSDSEFFERLNLIFGTQSIFIFDEVLYKAYYRTDSLTSDNNYYQTNTEYSYYADMPVLRQIYQSKYRKWHQEIKRFKTTPYIAFAPHESYNYYIPHNLRVPEINNHIDSITELVID